ncbi:helix-turn-helix transcriptional regulator [Sphingobacterium daejeonense]|jgi:transcriptional regulator with XRE-family HTH domain|uniref:Helix-turn-helix transcriptional regulator n=1 Tax=Sphingobacterium daejeonense TaxID=371142 RepID=A0ABW3RKL7_9SPHI
MQKESINSGIEQYVINKVKEIRVSKGISQAKLAHMVELSVGFVGNVENPTHIAKWNLNHLNRISLVLDVPFKDFFPEKGI